MKSVLVTGGAGFIGSHLCQALIKKKIRVICLDNFNDFYDSKIKDQNISCLQSQDNFLCYREDIRNSAALNQIFEKHPIDCVVHLAALAGVRPSINNASSYIDVNVTGTLNLLEACKACDVSKFIFASSSSVYGNSTNVPFKETQSTDRQISPYAASKKACEILCHTYSHLYAMNIIALRFFTVFGPRQRPDLAIHKFVTQMLDQQPITLYGDGSSSRDYTFVQDIVDGTLSAIEYLSNHSKVFEIINLGQGKPVTLKQAIETIESVFAQSLNYSFVDMPPGDVQMTCASIEKAHNLLNYQPKVSFYEGIEKFKDWHLCINT